MEVKYIKYLEEQLAIDPERLDEEWLVQPVLYDRAQQAVIDAERSMRAIKKNYLDMRASLWLQIKKDPEKFGINAGSKGATKDDIEQALNFDDQLTKTTELLESATEVVAMAKNFVKSVEMKKAALTQAVELWIANYYSTPKVKASKGGKQFSSFVYSKAEERMRQRLAESRKKREERVGGVRSKLSEVVVEQFDDVMEKEEKVNFQKKAKQLGLEAHQVKSKSTIKVPRRRRKVKK